MPRAVFLQHVPFEGPAALSPLLRDRGFDVAVHPVFDAGPPADLDGTDLLVATGGPMSVDDESLPWLVGEVDLIRRAIEEGLPVLGICLGSQLIAKALGARVERLPHREVGWYPIEAKVDDPLARDLCAPARVLHWHGERWRLPPGARLLAGSEACDHQAFDRGPRVLGLQFHLEMDRAAVAALANACSDELGPDRFAQSAETILAAESDFVAARAALENSIDLWIEGW